jgi:hypothetical protein
MEATAMTMMMHDVEDAMWDDAEAEDTWMRRQEEEASKWCCPRRNARHELHGAQSSAGQIRHREWRPILPRNDPGFIEPCLPTRA